MSKIYCALSYGQGGQALDIALSGGGIDRLAQRIKALGVFVEVFAWEQAVLIVSRIKAQASGTRIVVGGTSLGANEAPKVGALLKDRPVDLLFGIQPSVYGVHNTVTGNVKRALYFYQPPALAAFGLLGLGFGLGSYRWERSAGNTKTVMLSAYSFASHPGSNNEGTQNTILAEIKKLVV